MKKWKEERWEEIIFKSSLSACLLHGSCFILIRRDYPFLQCEVKSTNNSVRNFWFMLIILYQNFGKYQKSSRAEDNTKTNKHADTCKQIHKLRKEIL